MFVRREKLDRLVGNSALSDATSLLTEQELVPVTRRVRWFNAAARYPFNWARCLQRSLGLCLWMERQGLRPELKIGVRKVGEVLKAHAWVECCGTVLNDNPRVATMFVTMNGVNLELAQASLRMEE